MNLEVWWWWLHTFGTLGSTAVASIRDPVATLSQNVGRFCRDDVAAKLLEPVVNHQKTNRQPPLDVYFRTDDFVVSM